MFQSQTAVKCNTMAMFEYVPELSGCPPPTCSNPNTVTSCQEASIEGCACPPGFLKDEDKEMCVAAMQCSAVSTAQGEFYYNNNQWWRSRNLVSVSSLKGLGFVSQRSRSRGSKVSVSLETTLSRPQDLKGGKNENRVMKQALGWW